MIDKILFFPYYAVLKMRNARYSRKGRKFFSPDVPSVCVGNVTAGGTGKTPHVEMILRLLAESQEWKDKNLAVLSGGYKRESKGFQQVVTEGSVASFGDEPLQIKRNFPEVTVVVDKNRVRACNLLTKPEKMKSSRAGKRCWHKDFPAADYIVLDDAFQYRRLKAFKSIVLIDYNHPVHKDRLIPLGRLRDLPERVHQADAVIVTKCPYEMEEEQKTEFITDAKLRKDKQKIFFTTIKYNQPHSVFPQFDSRFIYSQKAILVTGIASDMPLKRYLSDSYKIVRHFSFPDHHSFTWADINKLKRALKRNPTAAIITTQKDAQRLLDFKGMPPILAERLLYVPIEPQFTSEAEKEEFKNFIV